MQIPDYIPADYADSSPLLQIPLEFQSIPVDSARILVHSCGFRWNSGIPLDSGPIPLDSTGFQCHSTGTNAFHVEWVGHSEVLLLC